MKKLLIFILLVVLTFSAILFYPYSQKNLKVHIQKGSSITKVAKDLKAEKVIISKDFFILSFLLTDTYPKAGVYEIKKGDSLIDVISRLKAGKPDLVKVVIVPGDDLFSISKKLQSKRVISEEEFLSFFTDKFKLLSIGFKYDTFEGFIVPDTYFLEENTSAKRLFKIFLKKFYSTYPDFSKDDYEYMIIASLIEKEAYTKEDKPKISSVIHNRLKKNMPLQIDATLLYLAKVEKISFKRITELKKVNSKYNTYLSKGLPPTPICSFSKESYHFAKNPAETPYFYYFTKDGKNHIFSKTYKEHLNKLRQK